jgi:cytochrome c peroxidase
VYNGKGRCNKCHGGAELSEATVSQAKGNPKKGFVNTAVRPVKEDGGDILQPGKAAFKTPALRNCELTGPYFHNGGYATLRQVVNFYNRGGDFPSKFTDSDVRPLKLTEAEKDALVDFMVAMTDERVRHESAPFDHPSLVLPNGASLPSVGAAGRGPNDPVKTFLNMSPFAE